MTNIRIWVNVGAYVGIEIGWRWITKLVVTIRVQLQLQSGLHIGRQHSIYELVSSSSIHANHATTNIIKAQLRATNKLFKK